MAEDYIQSESPQRSGTTYQDEHSTLKKKRSPMKQNQFDQNRGTAGFGASQASYSQSHHQSQSRGPNHNFDAIGEDEGEDYPYEEEGNQMDMDFYQDDGEDGEEMEDEYSEDENESL